MFNYIAKYFTLNRRERNAILALISLLFALILTKYFVVYRFNQPARGVVVVDLDSAAARLAVQEALPGSEQKYALNKNGRSPKKDSLFYFDPNLVTVTQAVQLGFELRCAQMLLNYRNGGGKFKKPADLAKLYCMKPELFAKLEPFIIIGSTFREQPEVQTTSFKKEKGEVSIEVNSADSTEWMKLRGIGPGYARRILKYRSMLGGFTFVEQIKEVYNFPDSLFQSIKGQLTVNASLVQKLKVNSAEFKTLVHHPYIKYEGTKCIFALKRDKKIKQEDLTNSSCFGREQLAKLLPYLDFE